MCQPSWSWCLESGSLEFASMVVVVASTSLPASHLGPPQDLAKCCGNGLRLCRRLAPCLDRLPEPPAWPPPPPSALRPPPPTKRQHCLQHSPVRNAELYIEHKITQEALNMPQAAPREVPKRHQLKPYAPRTLVSAGQMRLAHIEISQQDNASRQGNTTRDYDTKLNNSPSNIFAS